jgi:hypothetical protein
VSGSTNVLTVNGIEDLAGNTGSSSATFIYYVPKRNDVLITEIMADPSPPVGLPNAEYIELTNKSSFPISLLNWRIASSNSGSAPLPNIVLLPDSMLIVTSTSNAPLFFSFGRVAGVAAFPSINNEEGTIQLLPDDNRQIHTVEYADYWHSNSVKKEGGWSFEMADLTYPCGGRTNWNSSEHAGGGTPGKKNSTSRSNPDEDPPRLLRTFLSDSVHLVAVFNEPLDSVAAVQTSFYKLQPPVNINRAKCLRPLFSQVELELSQPLAQLTVYLLQATGVTDCKGNMIGNYNSAKAAAIEPVSKPDIIINEILFDPASPGAEYIELYNKSNKVVDVSSMFIGTRTGATSSLKKIAATPVYMFPEDYLLVTEDPESTMMTFLVKNPEQMLRLRSGFSLNNTAATIMITDAQGQLLDEVSYHSDWHFPLLTYTKGIALERVDPSGASDDGANWNSAAESAGFGTPTYRNSQFKDVAVNKGSIAVTPTLFSPNSDGYDDFTIIQYQLEANGYMGSIQIFDGAGKIVRNLVLNGMFGQKGQWKWDGVNDQGMLVTSGAYVIVVDVFDQTGSRKTFKNVVFVKR